MTVYAKVATAGTFSGRVSWHEVAKIQRKAGRGQGAMRQALRWLVWLINERFKKVVRP